MNWKQLYNIATPAEREQITFFLLEQIDINAVLPVKQYHYIGASSKKKNAQVLYLSIFMFILVTVSLATWLVSINVPPAYGAPLVFFWITVLLTIPWVRPLRRTC